MAGQIEKWMKSFLCALQIVSKEIVIELKPAAVARDILYYSRDL